MYSVKYSLAYNASRPPMVTDVPAADDCRSASGRLSQYALTKTKKPSPSSEYQVQPSNVGSAMTRSP
jgi:hypothetical protein